MPVLLSEPLHLGFNPLCFDCRKVSDGQALAKDVGGNMRGRQAR
jgi:hypothetical protein